MLRLVVSDKDVCMILLQMKQMTFAQHLRNNILETYKTFSNLLCNYNGKKLKNAWIEQ